MKHADLIARLEKLTGPDREVDAYVHAIFVGGRVHQIDDRDVVIERPIDGMWIRGIYPLRKVPRYTASLDAAVALVERLLPGWEWGRDDAGYMQLFPPHSDDCIERRGATPAIALLLALLRALQESDPAKETSDDR